MEWQPIATAPKDGTYVLVWVDGWIHEVRIARWIDVGDGDGWFGREYKEVWHQYPTHWMPLPEPPK